MKNKSKINSIETRSKEIDQLHKWGIVNTDLEKISINHTIIFFHSDIENIPSDLIYVYNTFQKLLEHAKKIFHIGNYIASEYAMAVILTRTKGIDMHDIYNIQLYW